MRSSSSWFPPPRSQLMKAARRAFRRLQAHRHGSARGSGRKVSKVVEPPLRAVLARPRRRCAELNRRRRLPRLAWAGSLPQGRPETSGETEVCMLTILAIVLGGLWCRGGTSYTMAASSTSAGGKRHGGAVQGVLDRSPSAGNHSCRTTLSSESLIVRAPCTRRAKPPERVHEGVRAGAGGADHVGERLLRVLGQTAAGPGLPCARERPRASQPLPLVLKGRSTRLHVPGHDWRRTVSPACRTPAWPISPGPSRRVSAFIAASLRSPRAGCAGAGRTQREPAAPGARGPR